LGNAYRDGKVHVLSERCATCIFTNGAFMGLRPGRRAEMVLSARKDGSAIICHETYSVPGVKNAVCKGFFDLPHQPAALQIAERLGQIEWVDP
jgi:hypothetical protein